MVDTNAQFEENVSKCASLVSVGIRCKDVLWILHLRDALYTRFLGALGFIIYILIYLYLPNQPTPEDLQNFRIPELCTPTCHIRTYAF